MTEKPETRVTRPLSTRALRLGAELATGRKLVGPSAAVDPHQVLAAGRPDDGGPRIPFGQSGQVEEHVGGRVPGADHQGRLAFVGGTVAPEHVRDAVGDVFGVLGLALGQDSARTQGIRGRPRPGGVDHRPGQVTPDRAVAVGDGQHEGLGLAALAEHLVGALSGDGRDLRARLDHRRHLGDFGQRLEVGLVQVRSRRHRLAGRLLPSVGLEQSAGCRVGVVLPRRE